MLTAALEQLLILQDRDLRCEHLKKQLVGIPTERAQVEAEQATAEAVVAAHVDAIRRLQVRAKELEGEVADAEERIVRYKTQQMAVKKNEEYQAFEHEIAVVTAQISKFEDEELELLEQIDGEQATLAEERAELERLKALFAARLRTLDATETQCRDQIAAAAEAVEASRNATEPSALKEYDFVRSHVRRAPYLSPLEGSKCLGCHLRVSGEVEQQARRGTALVRCSSCGRIVYVE